MANPGCYPTSAILALAPLLKAGLIQPQDMIVDSKSGVSGAGRTLKLTTHFPECNESVSAYNIGRHRHTPEIDQILGMAAGRPVEVIFTPQLVPMDRGILTTTYARPTGRSTEEQVMRRSTISMPTSRLSAWSSTCRARRTRPNELLRHHGPGGPRPRLDHQLPGQPDQGRLRCGGAELQPDVRLPGNAPHCVEGLAAVAAL